MRRPACPLVASGARRATYRLVIFDFDGTLVDSFPWFLSVVNSVADRYGFRRIAPGEVEDLRGLGAREIVRELGVPAWKLPLIAMHMRKLKAAHHGAFGLFPGVDDMLRELAARGLTLAIVSSDAEPNVRATLGAANAARIDVFACGVSLFGKAAKFRAVLKQTGIAFGAVAWGYAAADALAGTGPAALFRSIDEIAATLAPP